VLVFEKRWDFTLLLAWGSAEVPGMARSVCGSYPAARALLPETPQICPCLVCAKSSV